MPQENTRNPIITNTDPKFLSVPGNLGGWRGMMLGVVSVQWEGHRQHPLTELSASQCNFDSQKCTGISITV